MNKKFALIGAVVIILAVIAFAVLHNPPPKKYGEYIPGTLCKIDADCKYTKWAIGAQSGSLCAVPDDYAKFFNVSVEIDNSKECYCAATRDMGPINVCSPRSAEADMVAVVTLEEADCKQKGYAWVPIPGICAPDEKGESACGYRCDIRTADAGKTCYSNKECEGACLCTKGGTDSEGYQVGICSKYKYFTEVHDCPCILESKSKTASFPYGCA